ncbi:hypothetical protein LTR53_013903 [Teratosphaeriaceae sp. CCFEE 6253]|nr:hypothetical protein LTR53_013903 [Teratosphaeriaceae sp. CCFEE 6253]
MLRLEANDRMDWAVLRKVDYCGWTLLAASIVSTVLGLSWAGSTHQWTSASVLAPLIVGVVSLAFYVQYSRYSLNPILPTSILRRAKVLASCFGTLVFGLIAMTIVSLIPIDLAAAHGLGPTLQGALLAPWTLALVFGSVATAALSRTNIKSANFWSLGWALTAVGTGTTLLLKVDTAAILSVPVGLLTGLGLGVLLPTTLANIQTSASTDDETIHAAPLHSFLSSLGQTLGVAVGSCIFLNQLGKELRETSLTSSFRATDAVAMVATIQRLALAETELETEVVGAYIGALRPLWMVLCALASICFALSLWCREDTAWVDRRLAGDEEKGSSG